MFVFVNQPAAVGFIPFLVHLTFSTWLLFSLSWRDWCEYIALREMETESRQTTGKQLTVSLFSLFKMVHLNVSLYEIRHAGKVNGYFREKTTKHLNSIEYFLGNSNTSKRANWNMKHFSMRASLIYWCGSVKQQTNRRRVLLVNNIWRANTALIRPWLS